ncbi:MAG: precorrin-6y C5,15-methyltransferase (decarboxylating) subunit CbiE [Desulfobacterales bacterium]|jgi:precorrin-6y C5,15-methyltransferase (decarboxylating) CbiE subunit|nr:precorrin-6y C5,15-methyltransferase (decarboxylating) subunit CbiE [Desulfobacterales bacterium]
MAVKLTIVGCGPGAPEYLTVAGRQAIAGAEVLVGAPRLLTLFATPAHEKITFEADIDGLIAVIAARRPHAAIAVLVSGDPGLCSLAGSLLRRLGRDTCDVIPGVSSVQLAFARLGLDWRDARILSAHTSIPDATAADLAAFNAIVILAGHRHAKDWIADLAEAFGNTRTLVVCEDLTLQSEKIYRVPAAAFRRLEISTRTIVLLLKKDMDI